MPYSNVPKDRWDKMDRCVKKVMREQGVEKDRAIAICHTSIMGKKEKSIALSGVITKAKRMPDGRIHWRARVNSGDFDDLGERFDKSYFAEVVKNFAIQQQAIYDGAEFPIFMELEDGFTLVMDEPILDIAHYSCFIPPDMRSKARLGYPTKVWLDGQALMAEGYYDDSTLGKLAAKAALSEEEIWKRRVSIGTYPDWGLVKSLPDGKRVFRGGRGRSHLDHIAVTSDPVDTDTEILTLSEVSSMPTQKEDAKNVLGEEAESEIEELEEAKTVKSKAVVLKSEEGPETEEVETEDTEAEEAEEVEEAETVEETEVEGETEEVVETAPSVEEAVKSFMGNFLPEFGKTLVERIDATIKSKFKVVEDRQNELEAQMQALAADETVKIKSALESEDWYTNLVEKSLSVQHGNDETVVKGSAEKVKETHEPGEMEQKWGNKPKK